MDESSLILRWKQYISGIRTDVQFNLWHLHVHDKIWEIIKKNKKLPETSCVYDFFVYGTFCNIAMCIRRHAKSNSRTESFCDLLKEITSNSHVLAMKSKESCKFCMNVAEDLRRFKAEAISIEKVADKILAHCDKDKPKEYPNFSKLRKTFDLLDQLSAKYFREIYSKNVSEYGYDQIDAHIDNLFSVAWKN